MKISQLELKFSSMSLVDYGRVFWWRGRLFRGIPESHASLINDLFDSGLMQKLIERNLFVKSWISSIEVDGFSVIIEHDVLKVPTYPKEWSFSMLKDAAQLVLELNEVSAEYGYQTADCHGYNVLFEGAKPIYVDLGSFKPIDGNSTVLACYHEFLRCYYYPLIIWKTGGEYLGMKVAARVGTFVPCEAYLKYRWSIFRFFDDRTLSKVSRVIHAIRSIQHIDLNKIEARFPKSYLPLLKKVREFNLFSRPAKISYLKKLLIKLGGLSSETKWARYHDEFIQENKVISSPRFDYIADKLISLGVQSALEIAGNQGVLCSLLELKNDSISLICTDGDSNAVDKGYKLARNRGSKINWAVLNPFVFETSDSEIPVSDRFRSEAVLALALTHHLVLTQNFRLSNIFSTIKKFTSNYIFIEFMPMGLYNGVSAPQLPSWYSEKWFENEFLEHFELIEKKILEKNRVLFVGKVISSLKENL